MIHEKLKSIFKDKKKKKRIHLKLIFEWFSWKKKEFLFLIFQCFVFFEKAKIVQVKYKTTSFISA